MDLLKNPRSAASDLGKPVPDAPHAISVGMPRWQHVVDHGEKIPAVEEAFLTGYPRHFFHRAVAQLFEECASRFASNDECAFAFPSRRVAERALAFVAERTQMRGRLDDLGRESVVAAMFPKEAGDAASLYWQYSGEIISSRKASYLVEGGSSNARDETLRQLLQDRIANLVGEQLRNVFLFPTGMAGIFAAYRAITSRTPGAKSVQLGFPYADTLRIQQSFGSGAHFFPSGDAADLDAIEKLLQRGPLSAVFVEIPSNPLLRTVDLPTLSTMLRSHNVPLVIDDTLSTFVNTDALKYADILATSLTKYFSGGSDVMAGAIVLNSLSPLYDEILTHMQPEYEDLLWHEDLAVLERNSRDFASRFARINATAERLCDFLREHRAVERVYYPKFETADLYLRIKKPDAGFGGLCSILLKDAANAAAPFYDRLHLTKAPSLGTNFTLCIPYTMLTHYDELDWVEECGVSRYLIRVSVGLEDAEDLIDRFRTALAILD